MFLFLNLGSKFELTPQLEHPDKVGGMAIFGNQFLWSALIFSWPAIFLSVWYVIIKNFDIQTVEMLGGSLANLSQIRQSVFTFFLIGSLLLIVASLIAFILPLLSVHKEMQLYKNKLSHKFDTLSANINTEQISLLDNAATNSAEDNEKALKKIESMQKVHERYRLLPTWPYDTQTIVKFTGAQIAPILTMVGVSETIIDLAKSAFQAIG